MKHVKHLMLSLVFVAGLPVLSPPGAVQALQLSFVGLSGGYVVSPQGKANAGDPDGRGTAAFSVEEGRQGSIKICYIIRVDDIGTPTAVQLRFAGYGQNGPILLKLKPPKSGTNGSSSECRTFVRGVRSALVNRLFRLFFNPLGFYINVQTAEFPAGALRGQIN
jgi:hypothetical protein